MKRPSLPRTACFVGLAVVALACSDEVPRLTGYVEGEERVLRSEVAGRILAMPHSEGARVPPGEIVAEIDAAEIDARMATKRAELGMLDGEIRAQEERVRLTEATWQAEVRARAAEVDRAKAALELAERTFVRQSDLRRTGAAAAEAYDQARSERDQARSVLAQAEELLVRTEAEAHALELARRELAVLRERRSVAASQLAELEVLRAKYAVRSIDAETVVQTQLAWPGELAQPGTALVSVLDPRDKYVQIYVPVPRLAEASVGRRVEIEIDGLPGRRFPGEISFVADEASFTPEKIETRDDRIAQVYRAKVRILEGAEQLRPGTEGNVYLVGTVTSDGSVSTAQR